MSIVAFLLVLTDCLASATGYTILSTSSNGVTESGRAFLPQGKQSAVFWQKGSLSWRLPLKSQEAMLFKHYFAIKDPYPALCFESHSAGCFCAMCLVSD